MLKTLIVEDDAVIRLLLMNFLSPYGECHSAGNGREALEMFRSATDGGTPFDLICMDILMPEMDGQEALKQVRALEAANGILPADGVKIIMTTTVSDMKQVVQSFQGHCDAYLTKPIDTAELLRHMWSLRLI
jgi:two-component system chemotaxis response regulator CheY